MALTGRREMIQNDAIRPSSGRRVSAQSRPRKDHPRSRTGKNSTTVPSPPDDRPPDIEALRKARLNYINAPADGQRTKMKYIGETITREAAKREDIKLVRKVSGPSRRRKAVDPEPKHRQRKVRLSEVEPGEYQSVYERRHQEPDIDSGRAESERKPYELDDSDAHIQTATQPLRPAVERRSKTGSAQRPSQRDSTVGKHGQIPRRKSEPIEPVRRIRCTSSDADGSQPASTQRNTATRLNPTTPRPSLQRSTTTIGPRSDASPAIKLNSLRSKTAPHIAESHAKKGSSIFSGLLRSSPATQTNLKKVTCLTCGSDDVPIIKTAKLACSHRMCHDCLRRIFTMSVTDPAHMPPKCCTSEHIPLKHVDKLFDQKFKKTWNRKFQEYTTRNRIYCPARHCGEWIKPNHISLENGRKVAKCKRCGTRVCGICNNKMHTSRDCPKDPEAKIFVETAKKEGWKRCFNCSAMVELKEGCNHMTCRCTAEFCMICGNKWKTCDCPWFNYEAVEAGRLEHLNMGQGQGEYHNQDRRAPIRYQEEVDRRRHQERRDEALARRMQMLGVDDDPSVEVDGGDYPGQLFGIGNVAGHFLNHDFRQQARNILAGNLQEAARAADGLLNGAFTARETPLPLAPEVDASTPDATNQTAQLLRHQSISNPALNTAPRRRSNDRRAGNDNDAAGRTVVVHTGEPNMLRRPSMHNASLARRASGLAGFLAGGRSQTADERAAEQRIQNWRSDVPVGEPADHQITFV